MVFVQETSTAASTPTPCESPAAGVEAAGSASSRSDRASFRSTGHEEAAAATAAAAEAFFFFFFFLLAVAATASGASSEEGEETPPSWAKTVFRRTATARNGEALRLAALAAFWALRSAASSPTSLAAVSFARASHRPWCSARRAATKIESQPKRHLSSAEGRNATSSAAPATSSAVFESDEARPLTRRVRESRRPSATTAVSHRPSPALSANADASECPAPISASHQPSSASESSFKKPAARLPAVFRASV
mmetsp:Transcript_32047/g.110767  ORF Transcript_32047/g.110767 Transcript_32047/m.110767 type:complete len:252 (-) Transcript_32047:874-1629(-)